VGHKLREVGSPIQVMSAGLAQGDVNPLCEEFLPNVGAPADEITRHRSTLFGPQHTQGDLILVAKLPMSCSLPGNIIAPIHPPTNYKFPNSLEPSLSRSAGFQPGECISYSEFRLSLKYSVRVNRCPSSPFNPSLWESSSLVHHPASSINVMPGLDRL